MSQQSSPDREHILDAIRRAANELGTPLYRRTFIRHTGIREYHILKHFLSWNAAISAAGLTPDTSNLRINDETLLEDWGRIVRQLTHIPTRFQYKHHGHYSPSVFERHFGPWSVLPDRFREYASKTTEWNDVLPLLPLTSSNTSLVEGSHASSEISYQTQQPVASSATLTRHSKMTDRPVYGNPIDFRGLRHEPVNESGVILECLVSVAEEATG